MNSEFILPQANALTGDDRDALQNIFRLLVAEINRLRSDVNSLKMEAGR